MEYVLKTHELTKTYKDVRAVDGVNMNVPKGSIYGFVGRNGSGKTTLIRMVTGLVEPTSGSFTLYDASTKSQIEKARRAISAVVETPSIYLNMTAYQNLKLQCDLLSVDKNTIGDVLKMVNLERTGTKKAKDFSLGMKQRLGIAVALIGNPDFLILDEPTNGLDPEGIIEVRELLLKLNREKNITVLVSSHILGELSRIATHYGFIKDGKLIKEYSATELNGLCRKNVKVNLGSTSDFEQIMKEFPSVTEYKIVSDNEVLIYGEIDIADFAILLKSKNIPLINITQQNEDLESFYINLIGGQS